MGTERGILPELAAQSPTFVRLVRRASPGERPEWCLDHTGADVADRSAMQHTVLVLFLAALVMGPALSAHASSLDGSSGTQASHDRVTSSGEALPPPSQATRHWERSRCSSRFSHSLDGGSDEAITSRVGSGGSCISGPTWAAASAWSCSVSSAHGCGRGPQTDGFVHRLALRVRKVVACKSR